MEKTFYLTNKNDMDKAYETIIIYNSICFPIQNVYF